VSRVGLILALSGLLSVPTATGSSDTVQERRSSAGARLFRSLLAADLGLADKTTEDGSLLLLVFYTRDRDGADKLVTALEGVGETDTIRSLPVRIEATDDPTFAAYEGGCPAGIFLAQAPGAGDLRTIIDFGIKQQIIVYSPFEGHVEQGVLAGLSVGARVRPYLNQETLAASGIDLKAFLLKVTKVYP
jgi:hypothetical protein